MPGAAADHVPIANTTLIHKRSTAEFDIQPISRRDLLGNGDGHLGCDPRAQRLVAHAAARPGYEGTGENYDERVAVRLTGGLKKANLPGHSTGPFELLHDAKFLVILV